MRYKITEFGQTLTTREEAANLCDTIIQRLSNLSDGESIILDFSQIEFITLSLINMIISLWKRVIGGEFGEKFMVLHSLGEEVKQSFHVALCYANSVMVTSDPALELIGLIGDRENINMDLWNYVTASNGVTSSDTQREFSISTPNAASNRLRRLYHMRLIARTKKAGRVTYFPIP